MPWISWRGERRSFDSFEALAQSHDYGRDWYAVSRESIEVYAAQIRKPVPYVCDVLAILSPRVSVAQNVKLARAYLETGSAPGAMKQRLAALARYEASGVFNGPKVNAFSQALQGDPHAAVVDAWVYRLFDEETPNVKAHKRCVQALRDIADSLNWHTAETQAALWCGVRSLCGYSDSFSPLTIGA